MFRIVLLDFGLDICRAKWSVWKSSKKKSERIDKSELFNILEETLDIFLSKSNEK